MRIEHLDFITFCVGSLSDHSIRVHHRCMVPCDHLVSWKHYILPCYDVLHTFSKDYLVEELTEVFKERDNT